MHVLPPANGTKLWRIKRSVSGSPSSADASSSLECYNSSQRISAAGKQFMSRRPPLKRPKSKPGMPKDFVFVDLSPVKSEEKLSEENVEKLPGNESDVSSPTVDTVFSENSPTSSFSSFSNYNYASDDLYGACFDESLLGLGLMGVDFPEQVQPQQAPPQQAPPQQNVTPPQQTFPQFDMSFGQVSPISPTQSNVPSEPQQPQSQPQQAQQPQHKRRKSAGGFTFKSYTGPNGGVKKRKSQNHRRCFSEPAKKQQQAPTPPSMEEFLHMPKVEKFDGFDLSMVDEMGAFAYGEDRFKEEFDLQKYLSI
ncbi:uncharacterized protein CXQ87_002512 [Candidozyma duobushaemuli]|uniref:Uncharacterized protein n=2 Tax=Candidozyma TaxID=3303203 RepID=A0ABX8I630_9ASCO|nr:uncharacterized protein CXQ87_002512 [[Candida] duobushaemulonis]PVH14379.1 hypothetical protein CXQ87_002512 [[Candida] duobushaemulonis]QWU87447.1 hypothetical protein CA3LBN_001712 [[Candida] haemuloni]